MARVRGIHKRLGATEETTGRTYRVDDPDLLLWVHCCEVDSLLTVARRAGLPLTDEDADRYVAEQVTSAELIGIPRDDVPASVAELAAYFEAHAAVARGDPGRAGRLPADHPAADADVGAVPDAGPAARGAGSRSWRWRCCRGGPGGCTRWPGLGLTDAAATAALRAFRQTLLRLPQRARRSPIVWARLGPRGAAEPAA